MVRNTVKNAILDLHILLKSVLKMQEIPFQTPKMFREGFPLIALEFPDFAHVYGQISIYTRKFKICRPPGK